MKLIKLLIKTITKIDALVLQYGGIVWLCARLFTDYFLPSSHLQM